MTMRPWSQDEMYRLSALARYFSQHPVAAKVLLLVLFGLSFIYLPKLKHTLLPDLNVPMLQIHYQWPGTSAESISQYLSQPMEAALRDVPGVVSVLAQIETGQLRLNLRLSERADTDELLQQVRSRLNALANLPPQASQTEFRLEKFTEAVLVLALTGPLSAEQRFQFAEKSRSQLLELGVPQVQLEGWQPPELHIEVPATALAKLNLSLDWLARQLMGQTQPQSAGALQQHGQQAVLQNKVATSQLTDLQELRINPMLGPSIRLADFAQLRWHEQTQAQVRVNGAEALLLTLFRSAEQDSLQIQQLYQQWRSGLQLPPGLQLSEIDNKALTVQANLQMLSSNAWSGLLVVLLILWFTLSARNAIWTAAGIPVAVLLTLLAMVWLELSLNMISVFALIMMLGILVDDAIVISEGSATLQAQGTSAADAVEQAVRQLAKPVLLAALTTMAAFLPLLFIPGYIGQMLQPIALVVILALSASLLECFVLLPNHLSQSQPQQRFWHRLEGLGQGGRLRVQRWLEQLRQQVYLPLLRRLLQQHLLLMSWVLGLFFICMALFFRSFSDENAVAPDMDTLYSVAYLEAGINPQQSVQVMNELQQALQQAARELATEPAQLLQNIAISQQLTGLKPWLKIVVQLTPSQQRQISSEQLRQRWGELLPANSWVRRYDFSASQQQKQAEVSWHLTAGTVQQLQSAAAALVQHLHGHPAIARLETSFEQGETGLQYQLTPQARQLGYSSDHLALQLSAATQGLAVGQMQLPGYRSDIKVILPPAERASLDKLGLLPVSQFSGSNVPFTAGSQLAFAQLVAFSPVPAAASLIRQDGQLSVEVVAYLQPQALSAAAAVRQLGQQLIHERISAQFDISQQQFRFDADSTAARQSLWQSFPLALLGIYAVIVWGLGSFRQALLVLAVIPLGLMGAGLAHFIAGMTPGIGSLFGLFAVAGIMVNDSIVFISHLRSLPPEQAWLSRIIDTASARFRAILLTTLTTVAGLAPLLLDDSINTAMLQPMALSVVGGLGLGTLLLLLVLPALLLSQPPACSPLPQSGQTLAADAAVTARLN